MQVKMTKRKLDALEFIEELGSKFPDLPDSEVMLAYIEYTGMPSITVIHPQGFYGSKIITAYEKGVKSYYDGTSSE